MSRPGSGGHQGVSELHSCFGDDGLLWYVIKEGSDATIEDCYTSLDASLKLGGERQLPIYVNFGGLRSATREDRTLRLHSVGLRSSLS